MGDKVLSCPLVLQCVYGSSDERSENRDGDDGNVNSGWAREWRLVGLLYENVLILWRIGRRPEGDGEAFC